MKIIHDGIAYVQRGDVAAAYLSSTVPMPCSLISKVFPDFNNDELLKDHQNDKRYIKTTNKDEIDFLNQNDWIVDFNELKDLSIDELISLYGETSYEYNDIADKFNFMDEEERSQNISLYLRCKLLKRKVKDIKEIIDYKMELKRLNIPLKERISQKKSKSLLNILFRK